MKTKKINIQVYYKDSKDGLILTYKNSIYIPLKDKYIIVGYKIMEEK